MSVPKVVMPLCSRCRRVSVLDPCRNCATEAEFESYPPLENLAASQDMNTPEPEHEK